MEIISEAQAIANLSEWYPDSENAKNVLNTVPDGTVFSLKENEHDWQTEIVLGVIDTKD
jgi:cell division protein FtsX